MKRFLCWLFGHDERWVSPRWWYCRRCGVDEDGIWRLRKAALLASLPAVDVPHK